MMTERLKVIMISKFDSNGTPVMSQYGTSKFLKHCGVILSYLGSPCSRSVYHTAT